MKRIYEYARFFFISFEFLILILGLYAWIQFSDYLNYSLTDLRLSEDFLKYVALTPPVFCVWTFISGRKLLFPDKDDTNIFHEWQDFWKLKIAFNIALAWSVIFTCISLVAWGSAGKVSISATFVALAIALAGSAYCSLSVYNAQTNVELAISHFKTRTKIV